MTGIIIAFLRRPWAAAVLAALACVIHYRSSPAIYETAAYLQMVDPAAEESHFSGDTTEIAEPVLAMAMERLDEQRSKAGKALLDVERVASQLHAQAAEQEGQWKIYYHSQDREDAEAILTAVADAYVETSRLLETREALPQIDRYRRRKNAFQRRLNQRQKHTARLQRMLTQDAVPENTRQATMQRLKAFSEQLAQAKADRLKAEARYREADRELQQGSSVTLVAAQLSTGSAKQIVQAVMSHAELLEQLQHVRESKLHLQRFYGARHPRMIEAAAREAELKNQLSEVADNHSGIQQAGGTLPSENDHGQLLLKSLALDLQQRQSLEADLQEQIDLEQAKLDRDAELRTQLADTEQEIAAVEADLQRTADSLDTVSSQHEARVSILEPVQMAADPVSPSLAAHFVWGCIAALLAALLSHWAFRDLRAPVANTVRSTVASTKFRGEPSRWLRRLMQLARRKTEP